MLHVLTYAQGSELVDSAEKRYQWDYAFESFSFSGPDGGIEDFYQA